MAFACSRAALFACQKLLSQLNSSSEYCTNPNHTSFLQKKKECSFLSDKHINSSLLELKRSTEQMWVPTLLQVLKMRRKKKRNCPAKIPAPWLASPALDYWSQAGRDWGIYGATRQNPLIFSRSIACSASWICRVRAAENRHAGALSTQTPLALFNLIIWPEQDNNKEKHFVN